MFENSNQLEQFNPENPEASGWSWLLNLWAQGNAGAERGLSMICIEYRGDLYVPTVLFEKACDEFSQWAKSLKE